MLFHKLIIIGLSFLILDLNDFSGGLFNNGSSLRPIYSLTLPGDGCSPFLLMRMATFGNGLSLQDGGTFIMLAGINMEGPVRILFLINIPLQIPNLGIISIRTWIATFLRAILSVIPVVIKTF